MPVSIGVSFPESIMPGTPLPDIAGLAGLAEQAGLDGVWVGDRLAAGELSVLDSGDPAPTPKSWELLADVRLLLTQ